MHTEPRFEDWTLQRAHCIENTAHLIVNSAHCALHTHIEEGGAIDVNTLGKANSAGVGFQFGLLSFREERGLMTGVLKVETLIKLKVQYCQ